MEEGVGRWIQLRTPLRPTTTNQESRMFDRIIRHARWFHDGDGKVLIDIILGRARCRRCNRWL